MEKEADKAMLNCRGSLMQAGTALEAGEAGREAALSYIGMALYYARGADPALAVKLDAEIAGMIRDKAYLPNLKAYLWGAEPAKPRPRKLIIRNWQSPGDALMMAYGIRDLHLSNPGKFLTDVRTPVNDLWLHNPYITRIDDKDPEAELFQAEYPAINRCGSHPVQFIRAFGEYIAEKLNVKVDCGPYGDAVWLSDQEKAQNPVKGPYWVINAGYKKDYTCKGWSFHRYQQVVDAFPDMQFAQIGLVSDWHVHPKLEGANVIDFRGKTGDRDLIRLVYHARGVITPVSYAMHMAYSVPQKDGRRPHCIVLAGGREPNVWEQGPNHHFLHTLGMLPCCLNSGCWRSRVVPLGDGDSKDKDSLCSMPVPLATGQTIPRCMDMITAQDVINIIRKTLSV